MEKAVELTTAYKLLTPGQTVLIATKGKRDGQYNLTPIAWTCPLDYEPVTKVLFVSDPAHQAAANIRRTNEFAVCVPLSNDDLIIEQCGSVSSADADKFAQFSISAHKAAAIDVMIPENCQSWIECTLIRSVTEGNAEIFMGLAKAAFSR